MKTESIKINKKFVVKLLDTIKPGLCAGLGRPVPGEFCIMAAFNYALGRPHRDSGLEDCVGSAVRSFDILLNDRNWSSNQARAEGMRREAVAKIGSNQIDQQAFADLLCLKGVQRVLPFIFRLSAKRKDCKEPEKFLAHALECEQAKDLKSARAAAKSTYADASADAYAYASAYAYEYAYADADAYAYEYAYADAYADAYEYASAYAYAYTYADASADEIKKLGPDYMLKMLSDIAVDVLIELKSPGTKWLYLCDEK